MDALDWLLGWHNFPYLLALTVALLWSVLQIALGLVPDGIDADIDTDADVDVDLDLDVDIDTDIDVDVDADVDADVDVDADTEWPVAARFMSDAMTFFGVGKAPLSILILWFLCVFGSLGLLTNTIFRSVLSVVLIGWVLQALLLIVLVLVAGWVTGRMAVLLNKVLPQSETTSSGGNRLVGHEGMAASTITERGGQVRVASGWVDAVTYPGRDPIQKGTSVLLVAYDDEHFWYTAEPM